MDKLLAAVLIALAAYYIFCTYQSVRALFIKRLKKSLHTAALLRVMSAAAVLVGSLLAAAAHLFDEDVTYTYYGGEIIEHSSYAKIEPVLFALFIISTLMVLASIPFDCSVRTKESGKVRCVTVSLISAVTVILLGLFVITQNYREEFRASSDPRFFRYDSPINSRSIVICEKSDSSGTSGDIFQINGEKAEKIGSFSTENVRNEGKYTLVWTASQVTVTYLYDKTQQQSVVAKFVEL